MPQKLLYYFTGKESATAAVIFARMNEVFLSNEISWMNCIGAGVDNTSVNLGRKNSILTRVLEKIHLFILWDVPAILSTTHV